MGPSGKCSCAAFRGQSRVGAWRAARSAKSGLHGSALARQMFFVLSAYAVEWWADVCGLSDRAASRVRRDARGLSDRTSTPPPPQRPEGASGSLGPQSVVHRLSRRGEQCELNARAGREVDPAIFLIEYFSSFWPTTRSQTARGGRIFGATAAAGCSTLSQVATGWPHHPDPADGPDQAGAPSR